MKDFNVTWTSTSIVEIKDGKEVLASTADEIAQFILGQQQIIDSLEREIHILRLYGNKGQASIKALQENQ